MAGKDPTTKPLLTAKDLPGFACRVVELSA
jgi:hypothetical protein